MDNTNAMGVIEALKKERDHYKALAESRWDGAIEANQRADELAADLARIRSAVPEDGLSRRPQDVVRDISVIMRQAHDKSIASLARRDAELLNKPFAGLPGCSDGGCVVRKPKGMHTNGGCQCIRHQTASTIVQRLAYLRDELRRKAGESS